MHIVIADSLPPAAVSLLRSVPGWTVDDRAGRKPADLARDLAAADGLVVRSATRVDAALLEAAPSLRAVARAGTGVDNVDVEAASARGIVVMNAPGANSVSVAEHACALMLALARAIPAADAAMKQGRWEKRALTGEELRGKTLGIVGLGRIGQELSQRARGFGMSLVAHDPFISEQVAADLGVALVSLDELCARADYISLHLPSTAATRGLFDAVRLAACKRGVRIINTARGDLIDEDALAAAIDSGQVGGAGLDVFQVEPPLHGRLTSLPRVIATPHIAASTAEAQELVGLETAASLIDYLRDGTVRNAVNFPAIGAEEFARLRPFLRLGERLGALLGRLAPGRTHGVGIRYYGNLTAAHNEPIAAAVLTGLFAPMLSTPVTLVNARAIATARGVEVTESRSSRQRTFTSLLSVKLHTNEGTRWAEGTIFEPESPRLVLLDGVEVEAPLAGTLIVVRNADRPGVIGEVGTVLGHHGINIASFALGRAGDDAVGVVNVDEGTHPMAEGVLDEIRRIPAVREAVVIRFR
jgi:D-3-phosphoglycerate dehydrogenase